VLLFLKALLTLNSARRPHFFNTRPYHICDLSHRHIPWQQLSWKVLRYPE